MKLCSLLLISLLSALPSFATAQEAPKAVIVAEKAPGQAAIAEGIDAGSDAGGQH